MPIKGLKWRVAEGNLAGWPQPRCIRGQTPPRFCWYWDAAQHIAQPMGSIFLSEAGTEGIGVH